MLLFDNAVLFPVVSGCGSHSHFSRFFLILTTKSCFLELVRELGKVFFKVLGVKKRNMNNDLVLECGRMHCHTEMAKNIGERQQKMELLNLALKSVTCSCR